VARLSLPKSLALPDRFGPTGSLGRDALRRVLARNQPIVIRRGIELPEEVNRLQRRSLLMAFVDSPPLRDLRVLLCKFLLYLEQTAGFFD